MSKEKLTFSEFITLLLTRLYEDETANGPGKYIHLGVLAKDFKQDIPRQWVFDAGKVLEARGLAKCIFAIGGLVMASLTGEGRMFVEEAISDEKNVAKKYKENRENFINVTGTNLSTGSNNSQIINIEEERSELFSILKDIKEYINNSTIENKPDYISDLDSIESQLNKKEPNKSIIADLLEPFGKMIDIAGKVANFISLINL